MADPEGRIYYKDRNFTTEKLNGMGSLDLVWCYVRKREIACGKYSYSHLKHWSLECTFKKMLSHIYLFSICYAKCQGLFLFCPSSEQKLCAEPPFRLFTAGLQGAHH